MTDEVHHLTFAHADAQEGTPYFRTPALSADGHYVAFEYASDIWLVPTRGGTAERLTAHAAAHHSPQFSPDGTLLAFTSNRTSRGDIYVVPIGEQNSRPGAVQRLTVHDSYSGVEAWAPDGQHLYFTSSRDQQSQSIYRVSLAGETPLLIHTEPYENLSHVAVSPDGQVLAFNTTHNPWWRRGPDPYAPNLIWLLHLNAPSWHQAMELRYSSGSAPLEATHDLASFIEAAPMPSGRWPLWAPDGMGLYFVSDHTGSENIWYQPLHPSHDAPERQPLQITHFTAGRVLWPSISLTSTDNGKGMLVYEHEWQLWQTDLASGESAPIPIRVRADTKITPVYVEVRTRYFSEVRLAPDGKKIAFVAHGEIFADFADKETDKEQREGPSFRVTSTHSREQQVSWMPNSRSLVYISDRHGENELYRYDFTTRTETRLTNDAAPKWSPCCSPDGTWVAYIRGLDAIYLLNLKSGEVRPFAQGNFVRSRSLAWSPDSAWLAYLSHDARFFCNAYVQHLNEKTAHQITFLSNISGYDLLWAPNGRYLIFTSAQYRLESQIVRVDLRPVTPFLREQEFEKLFEDEKEKEKEKDKAKELQHEQQERSEELTTAAPDQEPPDTPDETPDTPTEAPDTPTDDEESGEQKKAEKPASSSSKVPRVEIVFAGIERRLRFLTHIQMDASAEAISPDSRDLLFLASVADKVNIWNLHMDEPRSDSPPEQLTASSGTKRDVQFSPDGKRFFYLDDGQIISRKFPRANEPTTLYVRGDVTIDFTQEKYQIFGEAWRLLRDTFYDPTFGGQDWDAIRTRFAPLIAGVQTHGDLARLLNLMVGELRASHLGAFWGGSWRGRDGYTGLIFDPLTQREQGALRIAAIVPDSPVALLDTPPRIGEYLVAIDGTTLTAQSNVDALLQRTVGRRVLLRLAATPAGDDAREVAVRPVDEDTYEHLRYRAWVNENKAYVHRISNGRLGYIHVEAMSYYAYQQFFVDLDAETYNRDGLVLDVRYNGGGHVSTFILDVLARRTVLISGFRQQISTNTYHLSGNRAFNKPTILLTNASSASDAEVFTETYRRLGLGKVVGKPTAGSVIWTINWPLLNNFTFRLPIYSVSTPEGENLEGTGRPVDIEVERPPGEWALGRDRQIEAAVAALLEGTDAQG
jgi:Tol biopolymer transport system component/C-terminal processing protease CtpA/Prc